MVKYIVIIIVFVAAAYAGITFFGKDNADTTVNSKAAALSVTVVSPQQGTITEELNVTGMTIPREDIMVMTELSNIRIKDILADVGDVVEKGQELAVLDGESLNNQLAQLQSDYERARDEFSRVNAIKDTGAISRESVVQKRTAMQSAKAKLDDANLNLKRSTIIAPESGVIFERKAAIGALINPNEPLYRIARQGEIEVEAHVPEADIQKLKLDQDVRIQLTGSNDFMDGKIRLIAPNIDSINRTATIRISFLNPVMTAVGLFANVNIAVSEKSGVVLPSTTIQQDSDGSFVWKLDASQKALRLPVTVLLRNSDSVMVNDIPTDISVIARAGAFVKEGDVVNVVKGK